MSDYNEKYRPKFHYSPKKNWMNDPNGMVYFNEEYHLFYQYHPDSSVWGPMHWGHAVSRDLIHWEELPIALYPDSNGAIFSGSAVVDWNNTTGFFDDGPGLVAIFTSSDTYPNSDRPRQRQSLAYSKDNGRTWVLYNENPVLSDVDKVDFRDPKVFWYTETNKWVMVLATGETVTIYTSSNLKEWEFASEFGHQAGSHDGVWECPDLFPLPIDGDHSNQKWVLLVSIGNRPELVEGSRTQYFIGDFDGETFVNENSEKVVLWLDYGRDNYAGVSWSDIPVADGRRVYIGWMSNWHYANQVPTNDWRSSMTLPRELSLTLSENGVRIVQKPVDEVKLIRNKTTFYKDVIVEGSSEIYPISETIELVVDFKRESAAAFGLLFESEANEKLVIRYDLKNERLVVDRNNSGQTSFSTYFAASQEAPLKLTDDQLRLEIYLDTSSIEVFANSGEVAITSLFFPTEPVKKVCLFSDDGRTTVNKMELTELTSIWE